MVGHKVGVRCVGEGTLKQYLWWHFVRKRTNTLIQPFTLHVISRRACGKTCVGCMLIVCIWNVHVHPSGACCNPIPIEAKNSEYSTVGQYLRHHLYGNSFNYRTMALNRRIDLHLQQSWSLYNAWCTFLLLPLPSVIAWPAQLGCDRQLFHGHVFI